MSHPMTLTRDFPELCWLPLRHVCRPTPETRERNRRKREQRRGMR